MFLVRFVLVILGYQNRHFEGACDQKIVQNKNFLIYSEMNCCPLSASNVFGKLNLHIMFFYRNLSTS